MYEYILFYFMYGTLKEENYFKNIFMRVIETFKEEMKTSLKKWRKRQTKNGRN